MIIVRLLSPRAFMVGFGTTKFTRAWEPALLWNKLTYPFSARASHARRSSRQPHARAAGSGQSQTPESVVVGVGSAGKWQIPTEAGGTFWLLPSSPVFKIERPK